MKQERVPEETLIGFLLGELNEAEQERVDDLYFSDEGVREQLAALEDELIDSYVRGELTTTQTQHFEDWFLVTEERHRKLAFARTLNRYGAEEAARAPAPDVKIAPPAPPPWWQAFLDWFQQRPVMAWSSVAVVAAALVIGISLQPKNQPGGPPTAANPGVQQAPKILAFTLLPTTRQVGRGNEVNLPAGEPVIVRLRLPLNGSRFERYTSVIRNVDSGGTQAAAVSEVVSGEAQVDLLAAQLPMGDYIITLSGSSGKGAPQTAAAYSFQVRTYQRQAPPQP